MLPRNRKKRHPPILKTFDCNNMLKLETPSISVTVHKHQLVQQWTAFGNVVVASWQSRDCCWQKRLVALCHFPG